MRAIAHKAACAAWLCLVPAAADDAEKVRGLLFELSTSLEARDAASFLARIDKSAVRDYGSLESNVVALAAQYEVASSIGIVEQTRTGDGYDLKLDWLLQVRPASGEGPARRWSGEVRCRVEPRGKTWKVTALDPVAFFKPS